MLNKTRTLSAMLAGVVGLLFTSGASAAGTYIGGQIGYGMTHQPGFTSSDIADAGLSGSTYTTSNTPNGIAGRGYGGIDLINYVGVEMGYTKFSNQNAKVVWTAPVSATIKETVKTYAIDLLGKVKIPLANNFDLLGKLGVGYVHGSGNGSISSNGTTTTSNTETDQKYMPTLGLGAGYELNPCLAVDISWLHYQKVGSTKFLKNQDFFGIGAIYQFSGF